jgi:hypothetical protein
MVSMSTIDTDVADLFDTMVTVMLETGRFESVNQHEPKSAPSIPGMTLAIFHDDATPIQARSGLATTSVRVLFRHRIYRNMLGLPEDMIEPQMLAASLSICNAYTSQFTLGGRVAELDLLGAYPGQGGGGLGLSERSGYIDIDRSKYRTNDLWVAVVINDLFTQAP